MILFTSLYIIPRTGLLCSYDSVFALDSDIVISTEQLNELFIVRELYSLDMLGPTQSDEGKISYRLLKPDLPFRKLRYACVNRWTRKSCE